MPRKRRQPADFFACPNCGADVPAGKLACPQCGADDQTGWSEDANKWEADIPDGYANDDDFDYDEYVAREFPRADRRPAKSRRKKRMWAAMVAMAVAATLIYLLWR